MNVVKGAKHISIKVLVNTHRENIAVINWRRFASKRPFHDVQIEPRKGWPHHASTQHAFISQNSRAALSRSVIGTSVLKTFANDHGALHYRDVKMTIPAPFPTSPEEAAPWA